MVTSGMSPDAAGVKVSVERLSRSLADLQLQVRVFGPRDSGWLSGAEQEWEGAPAVALPTIGPAPMAWMPRLADALYDWQPDIVHLHGLWTLPGRSVLQWHRMTGNNYVVSPHGMLAPAALAFSRWKKKVVGRWFHDAVFASAAAFHATSTLEKEAVRSYGLYQPVFQIPNGIDLPQVTSIKASPAAREILSLGRMHPIKGLVRLLQAWLKVEADFPDWNLHIVGPDQGGYRKELQRLSDVLGLQHVRFSPAVGPYQRNALMQGAAMFVLPSISENFAMTVAESLAAGTPVIASKGTPWEGLIENRCGWWVGANEAELAATLRQAMMLEDNERQEMGRLGREWMRSQFAWPAIASSVVEAYQEIMSYGAGQR